MRHLITTALTLLATSPAFGAAAPVLVDNTHIWASGQGGPDPVFYRVTTQDDRYCIKFGDAGGPRYCRTTAEWETRRVHMAVGTGLASPGAYRWIAAAGGAR